MKRTLSIFLFLLCALSAYSEELPLQRSRFTDNWSITLSAGAYHPMLYPMKYLADCSGWMGSIELRKQLMPALALGVEADGYMRLHREERKDPRTVIGPAMYLNITRLIKGYGGHPDFFEVEVMLMPAWGHLYRGTNSYFFPDENYFAVKFGADFRFALGRDDAWTLGIRPAMVYDLSVPHGNQYESFDINHADLQLTVGATYHFRGLKKRPRHLAFARPQVDTEEINRLNDIVNYLRSDVRLRDEAIAAARSEADSIAALKAEAEQRLAEVEKQKSETLNKLTAQYETYIVFPERKSAISQQQMPMIEGVDAFLKAHPKSKVSLQAAPPAEGGKGDADLPAQRLESVARAISVKTGLELDAIATEVKPIEGLTATHAPNVVKIIIVERKTTRSKRR